MKLKKLTAALAVSACAFAGQAFAVPASITLPPDLSGAIFTNIDWANTGTAFTQGFQPVAGKVFTITYFADAVAITNGLATVNTPTLDTSSDGPTAGKNYELTTVATLQERVLGCIGTLCAFDIISGNFNVYFDPSRNANNGTLGTGFSDGELLISGSVASTTGGQGGTFTSDASGLNGGGNASLNGTVTFTQTTCSVANPACISPALTGTNFFTTLQLGSAKTAPTANGYAGTGFTAADTTTGAGNIVFQADGNQAFVVPEPDSVLILGLGAGLMALTLRRRRQG